MKILVINWQDIKNPSGGGAEKHLHEIFKRIVSKGHDVTLYCSSFKGAPARETIDGIEVIRQGSRNMFNFLVPLRYLTDLKKKDFDIVIDDINKIPFYTPLFVNKPLIAISHHFFGKSIFMEAGFLAGIYVFTAEKLIEFIYKKIPFAVVSQSTLEEFINRGFPKGNFTIIPNAINHSEFPLKTVEKSFPNITYFGRLKKYKSVDHVIRAFAIVNKKFPDLKLNIAGSGNFQNKLENITQKLGLSLKIKFWGFISEEDKIRLLSNSYCVINPSIKEGWGITNIEANACGTLVISADVPGLRDSVSVDVSGILYKYGDIEELASCIVKILENEDFRRKLSQTSIDWAKIFSWDESADKMLKLSENVIKTWKQSNPQKT